MALDGPARGTRSAAKALVAGDVRANENIALTATHTLFAREHNRIVDALPRCLPEEQKFQIARRVVGAEQQYITYNEFLPALGVRLPRYRGYDPTSNARLANEFAVVGYRAHSMIHGELEPIGEAADYTAAQLAAFEAQGVEVVAEGDEVEFVVPLNVAFGNPDLLEQVGLDAVLEGLGGEPQYKNDEQIDNQLRSVLFQVPVSGNPSAASTGRRCRSASPASSTSARSTSSAAATTGCRSYNELRRAYGLRAEDVVHGDHRRVDRAVPGRPADHGQPDRRSGHPRLRRSCATSTATRSRSAARRPTARRSSASAARRSRRG